LARDTIAAVALTRAGRRTGGRGYLSDDARLRRPNHRSLRMDCFQFRGFGLPHGVMPMSSALRTGMSSG
jgi:hypothetical protein